MRTLRDESGQAAVEFVALLPLVALVVAVLWQTVLAGQAVWSSAGPARRAAGRGPPLPRPGERRRSAPIRSLRPAARCPARCAPGYGSALTATPCAWPCRC